MPRISSDRASLFYEDVDTGLAVLFRNGLAKHRWQTVR
jgi:hypothetical protein